MAIKRLKFTKSYKLESELCDDFRAWLLANHPEWTIYPETGEWDMLCVHQTTGDQVGIQAKLKANCCVLRQAVDGMTGIDYGGDRKMKLAGPHYRCVLVPSFDDDFMKVCRILRVVAFKASADQKFDHTTRDYVTTHGFETKWQPSPFEKREGWRANSSEKYRIDTQKPVKLPEYVPDVAAGVKCPTQLTPWKIGMLRVIAIIEIRGHVTNKQAKEHGIHASRLSQMTCEHSPKFASLIRARKGVYKLGPAMKHHLNHPEVYPQIVREMTIKLQAEG
jgi:hypothetical protein